MKKSEIVAKVNSSIKRVGFKARKHSPEILVVTGVIGAVASTILACKATTKLSGILEESKEQIDTIHDQANNEEIADQYTKEDARKDLAIVYAQTGFKLVRLYAPAVGLSVN